MDTQQVMLLPQPQQASSLTATATLQQVMPTSLNQNPQPPKCAICGTTQKLLRCAKCKCIYYCSTDHQHRDWATHKLECRQLAKQRQNNQRMQQLTNGCSAININSNFTSSSNPQLNTASGNASWNSWPTNYPNLGNNLQYSQNPDGSLILGTNENEIMHTKAETVAQNSNSGEYMGNFVNSTTSNQLHAMQGGGPLTYNNAAAIVDNNQQLAGMTSYYGNAESQQQSQCQLQQQQQPYSVPIECQQNVMQQQQQQQMYVPTPAPPSQPHQQQMHQPMPQFSNHLVNQHEKSSSYQIGAANVGDNFIEDINERRYEELCRNIINDMNQYGLSVVDDFLGREKGMQILNEVLNMYSAGVFKDGQLVNNFKSDQDLKTIRGDKITWVKGVEPGCSNVGFLINQIDAVICRANAMRNNGKLGDYVIKERTKAMVACYPGSGSHYVMHVDNPNKDGRVITAIYYLNLNWDSRDSGGVLRIFPEQAKSVADIEPKFDRLIFFWSDKRNPHEVQPAHRTRYAITVWYFDANEREAALNRCKNTQNNKNTNSNNSTSNPSNTTSSSSSSSSSVASNNTNTSSSAASSSSASSSSASAPPQITNSNESHASANEYNNTTPQSPTLTTSSSAPNCGSALSGNSAINSVRPVQVVLPNCYK
uniref:hypoxia-inducible factor-proline dioxygenase n=1 Tax=Musca domestica TaxID=7370 RepID=A0A1I8M4E7_MUSDO